MHKCIKYEYQPSGRGLLLTIFTSVGKYLYVGLTRQKTHLRSKKTHSSIQGKRRRPIRARHSASHGSMGPPEHATNLGQCGIRHNRSKGPPITPAEDELGQSQQSVGRPKFSSTDLPLACGNSTLALHVGSK